MEEIASEAIAHRHIVAEVDIAHIFDHAVDAFGRLKHLYTLLGAPDNVALHIGPTGHGYSVENREAMYRWFNRATGQGDTATEPAVTIETDETLACTPFLLRRRFISSRQR